MEGERKHLTILHIDVKGSMDMAQALDPEQWYRVIEDYVQIVADAVHRFEGTMNQFTGDGVLALPAFAMSPAFVAARAIAALVAIAALYGSIRAWRQMGSHWTMAVTRDESATLLTAGVFSRIRHPIYAFSIVLMLATLVVVPTWPMLLVAAVHVTLMALKARNEERFLLAAHGERYASYCRHTGRFMPRFTGNR